MGAFFCFYTGLKPGAIAWLSRRSPLRNVAYNWRLLQRKASKVHLCVAKHYFSSGQPAKPVWAIFIFALLIFTGTFFPPVQLVVEGKLLKGAI